MRYLFQKRSELPEFQNLFLQGNNQKIRIISESEPRNYGASLNPNNCLKFPPSLKITEEKATA